MLNDGGDFVATGLATTNPVITKTIQPWKTYSHEAILQDLLGCILQQWAYYRQKFNASYSQREAISDAYHLGIRKAIERDKKAPKLPKIIKCQHCSLDFKKPQEAMPGDARADLIYANAPADRVPKRRKITVQCPKCGVNNSIIVYKTVFSTCVFPYIRAAIQRGVVNACSRNGILSLDGFAHNDGSLYDSIPAKEEEEHNHLPQVIIDALDDVIHALSDRQQSVLAMSYGIGGVYKEMVKRDITCPHCLRAYRESKDGKKPNTISVDVDYSCSRNTVECPDCHLDIDIDMCMSQTDIAKHLQVSKQRICSTLKSVINRLKGNISHLEVDYPKWKRLTDKLRTTVSDCVI